MAELEESRQSLKRALFSFMAALKQPVLSEEEVKQRSEALDMSLATRKFEADISSGGTAAYHLVTGEMARVLLLQVCAYVGACICNFLYPIFTRCILFASSYSYLLTSIFR